MLHIYFHEGAFRPARPISEAKAKRRSRREAERTGKTVLLKKIN